MPSPVFVTLKSPPPEPSRRRPEKVSFTTGLKVTVVSVALPFSITPRAALEILLMVSSTPRINVASLRFSEIGAEPNALADHSSNRPEVRLTSPEKVLFPFKTKPPALIRMLPVKVLSPVMLMVPASTSMWPIVLFPNTLVVPS